LDFAAILSGVTSILSNYTAVIVLACIFIPMEHLLPLHSEQRKLRRQWLNDLFYLLFNGFVVRFGFVTFAGAIMVAYNQVVPPATFDWVTALPLWVQVPAVIVIADIGYYTAHRMSHAVPFLWKFHAVHHSIEEMDWLATHRVHPVDQVLSSMISLLPVYFLGFSATSIVLYQAIYQAQALLIHSNVRMNFGPLKYLFASPEYHHWHHANQKEAYDRNFAAQLSIIDVVAGTMFMPARRPEKYGLTEPMPETYPQQFVHPFRDLLNTFTQRFKLKAKP
jgi:sterol desaturase/sphingolipid hydroxylase (fatty acid hydroxylase superfamily)